MTLFSTFIGTILICRYFNESPTKKTNVTFQTIMIIYKFLIVKTRFFIVVFISFMAAFLEYPIAFVEYPNRVNLN